MPAHAIIVPVGPNETELPRVLDLLDSIALCEPSLGHVLLIDDAETSRKLESIAGLPAHVRLSAVHLQRPFRRKYRHALVPAAVILGLQWVQRRTDCDFVVKLDTDSLVIAPFAARIRARFAQKPRTGMLGSHTLDPNGGTRNITAHEIWMREMHKPRFLLKAPVESYKRQHDPNTRFVRAMFDRAIANGYSYGEHCLGGGYALSRAALDRMMSAGDLDDPLRWLHVDLAEDVVLGMLIRAIGMDIENFHIDGGVFGVKYIGLPDNPQNLLNRGFAITHSLKGDPRISEADIRAFFRDQRTSLRAGLAGKPEGRINR